MIGLMAGSITLIGGHGTAGAWGSVMENQYGLTGATTLGMACATFGLVIGGILGGPWPNAWSPSTSWPKHAAKPTN